MLKNVTFVISTLGNGGAERVISVLSNELINRGFQVNLITIYGDKVDYPLNSKVKYYPIVSKSNVRILRSVERLYKLRSYIKQTKSSLIISFLSDVNIHTLVATFLMKLKVIVSERNDPNQDPPSKIIRSIRDFVYPLSDGFVFQTPDAQSYFSTKIQARSIIIENPIKDPLPYRFIGERKKEIVAVSRLSAQKNLQMLIGSFARIEKEYPEFKLKIYGEGPLREELENYSQKLQLANKVILPGFKSNVHDEIKDSFMFILSSNYEGISNSMLEALAIGIPVISTDCPVGGARINIISYENGILIPVGDSDALYKAMKRLIEDPVLLEKISKNAVKIKERLSSEQIVGKWIRYLNEIGS